MDIQLQPDDALDDDQVHVSPDIDCELLEALVASELRVVVDPYGEENSIRMSARLVDRICEWMDRAQN